jgi:hypothetical protein
MSEDITKKSDTKKRWLIDTFIEGILFFLPIFVFLTIIRDKTKDDRYFDGIEHPMWFSEPNVVLIASFLFCFIVAFLIYYYIKYKKIDPFAWVTTAIISGMLILMTTYCCESMNLHGREGEIYYSILPTSFYVYSFLIIEIFWLILSYKRKEVIDFLDII